MNASSSSASTSSTYPENPALLHFTRGAHVESQVRGSWVLVDARGAVLNGAGHFDAPYFVRSAIKCVQALPLLEGGAAEKFELSDAEVALCVASHSGEPCHTDGVAKLLARLELDAAALQCGTHPPFDAATRRALEKAGLQAGPLHHNCSGKHAGFLALAKHLGVERGRYLDPDSAGQRQVQQTVLELAELNDDQISLATDGCSAPTFRMPLVALARAFARVCTPHTQTGARGAACARIVTAVQTYPQLVAGNHDRLCTELLRELPGSLFPKIGAEAVYALGNVELGQALAIKIDDGESRGLHAFTVQLLQHLGWLAEPKSAFLRRWAQRELKNAAGITVGRVELQLAAH